MREIPLSVGPFSIEFERDGTPSFRFGEEHTFDLGDLLCFIELMFVEAGVATKRQSGDLTSAAERITNALKRV